MLYPIELLGLILRSELSELTLQLIDDIRITNRVSISKQSNTVFQSQNFHNSSSMDINFN